MLRSTHHHRIKLCQYGKARRESREATGAYLHNWLLNIQFSDSVTHGLTTPGRTSGPAWLMASRVTCLTVRTWQASAVMWSVPTKQNHMGLRKMEPLWNWIELSLGSHTSLEGIYYKWFQRKEHERSSVTDFSCL